MTIATRPTIPAERYRRAAGRGAAAAAARPGFDALLVGVGPDLRYLTGYPAMPLERLTMLVIPAGRRAVARRAAAGGDGRRPARRLPPGTSRS